MSDFSLVVSVILALSMLATIGVWVWLTWQAFRCLFDRKSWDAFAFLGLASAATGVMEILGWLATVLP